MVVAAAQRRGRLATYLKRLIGLVGHDQADLWTTRDLVRVLRQLKGHHPSKSSNHARSGQQGVTVRTHTLWPTFVSPFLMKSMKSLGTGQGRLSTHGQCSVGSQLDWNL